MGELRYRQRVDQIEKELDGLHFSGVLAVRPEKTVPGKPSDVF